MEPIVKAGNTVNVARQPNPRLYEHDEALSAAVGEDTQTPVYNKRFTQAGEGLSKTSVTTSASCQQYDPLFESREIFSWNQFLEAPPTACPRSSAPTEPPICPELLGSTSKTHADSFIPVDFLNALVRANAGMDSREEAVIPQTPAYDPHQNTFILRSETHSDLHRATSPPPQQVEIGCLPRLRSSLRNRESITEGTTFPCKWSDCNQSFDNVMLLRFHVTETHVRRGTSVSLKCAWVNCGNVYKKRDNITSHLHTHIPYFEHECDYCGRKWQRRHDLTKHVKQSHAPVVLGGFRYWPVKRFVGLYSDRSIAVTEIGSFQQSAPLDILPEGKLHYIKIEEESLPTNSGPFISSKFSNQTSSATQNVTTNKPAEQGRSAFVTSHYSQVANNQNASEVATEKSLAILKPNSYPANTDPSSYSSLGTWSQSILQKPQISPINSPAKDQPSVMKPSSSSENSAYYAGLTNMLRRSKRKTPFHDIDPAPKRHEPGVLLLPTRSQDTPIDKPLMPLKPSPPSISPFKHVTHLEPLRDQVTSQIDAGSNSESGYKVF